MFIRLPYDYTYFIIKANIFISSDGTAALKNCNVSHGSLDVPTLTQVGEEEWYWMAPEVENDIRVSIRLHVLQGKSLIS